MIHSNGHGRRVTPGSCRRFVAGSAIMLALLCAAGTPASAQRASAAPAADDSQARESEARALVEITEPSDRLVDTVIRVLDRDMVKALREAPAFQDLEAANPGFLEAYWVEVKPVMAQALRDRVPTYHQRLAKLYAERLSLAELRSARTFFSGPVGQRMISLVHENADFGPMLAEAANDPNGAISESSYDASMAATVRAAGARLTAEEKAGIIAFGMSPAGSKISSLHREGDQIAEEVMNAQDPALDARIDSIRDQLLARLANGRKHI